MKPSLKRIVPHAFLANMMFNRIVNVKVCSSVFFFLIEWTNAVEDWRMMNQKKLDYL